MGIFPGPDEASAHWTFPGLNAAGLLVKEGGRLDLDLTPRNLVAPAYGMGTNGKTGRWRLDGVNQYGDLAVGATLPATRWYANAPTTALTVAIVARFNAPAVNDVIFSCLNAGPTRGLAVLLSAAERVRVAAYDAAGAIMSATMSADAPLTGRTRVVVVQLQQATGLARSYVDSAVVAAAFAGSANPIAYDAAILPTVGAIPGGGNYHDGDFFALCFWPRIVLEPEIAAWTNYWRERS